MSMSPLSFFIYCMNQEEFGEEDKLNFEYLTMIS